MTPWSALGADFLRDTTNPHYGDWGVGQGVSAPDRVHLREILTELEPCSLLDVGCGTGIELDGILAEGLKVNYAGIDITPEFVQFCRQRFPGVTFMTGNASALFAAGVYDVVSARAVLEHLEHGTTAFRNLFHACRKVCVISWFIPPGDEEKIETTEDGFIHHQYNRIELTDIVTELKPKAFHSVWHRTPTQTWEQWILWR